MGGALFGWLVVTLIAAHSVLQRGAEATPSCNQRYVIPPVCQATQFTSEVDGQLYRMEQSVEKVLCLMKRAYDKREITTLNGMHFGAMWESYRMARELGIWVYKLLGIKESIPLKFAFYPTRDGNQQNCLNITTEPYITGGGTPLCRLLHEMVEFGDGSLIEFFLQAMDYGYDVDPEGFPYGDKWEWTPDLLAQIRRLGFEPYIRFLHQYNTNYVYDPTLDPFGQQLQNPLSNLPPGYFGLSGGGGSGSGYQISCLNVATRLKTRLMMAGGGMNAGMTSGDRHSNLHGYGIGNAGVDIFVKGKKISLSAYAGKSMSEPYGKVISPTNTKKEWKAFADGMKVIMREMKTCHATHGHEVIVEGGGGGGIGLETYINADAVEREPHAMDVGFQFQYVLGNHILLEPNADSHEIPFVVCPYAREGDDIPWRQCVSADSRAPTLKPTYRPTKRSPTVAPTKRAPTIAPGTTTRIPTVMPTRRPNSPTFDQNLVFQCSSMTNICKVATFENADGATVPYQYEFYPVCLCYVQNLYLERYLVTPPPYTPNCTHFQPPAPDPNAHFDQAWCKNAFERQGCPKYPLCNK